MVQGALIYLRFLRSRGRFDTLQRVSSLTTAELATGQTRPRPRPDRHRATPAPILTRASFGRWVTTWTFGHIGVENASWGRWPMSRVGRWNYRSSTVTIP